MGNEELTGIVKKIADKGFGFISVEGHSKDVFFHAKSLKNVRFDQLKEGDTVSFEIEDTEKGPNAINIMVQE